MDPVPSIDLHPESAPGGPDAAVRACRDFLDKALAAGRRQVRIITGLGLRGDGTPRLRSRIEEEVLPSYFRQIEQRGYEQGGAVIRLWLRSAGPAPTLRWHREHRREQQKRAMTEREERFQVARDRLDLAETAWEEGDLRRCRLKLNQIRREFGWEIAEGVLEASQADALLDDTARRLRELDP